MVKTDWTTEELREIFATVFAECGVLMERKNHDYGNSWAYDRPTTFTDTIRHKIDRIINLERLQAMGSGKEVDEAIEDNLKDIINYAVFRLIKEREKNGENL